MRILYTICMENGYVHDRTCVYNINYHLIWCTKYRRRVLSEKISERLYELLSEIGDEKGFTVVEAMNRIMSIALYLHRLSILLPTSSDGSKAYREDIFSWSFLKYLKSYGKAIFGTVPISAKRSVRHHKIISLPI